MRREWHAWLIGLTVSLLLHGGVLWQRAALISATDGRAVRQAGPTRVSLRHLSRSQPQLQTPELPPPISQPEPIPKPKPRPTAEPKPHHEAHRLQPSPVPASEAASPAAAAQQRGNPELAELARRTYLGRLAAHIEQYKRYPRAARRRRLEGVVQVSFTLQRGGDITALAVEQEGAHPLLVRAAEQTIHSALPLPVVPPGVDCPMPVRFGMEFALR